MQATVIKISDILKDIGKKDNISFDGLILDNIKGLDESGIKGKMEILSLSENSVLVKLELLECTINEESEFSGEKYSRKVKVQEFTGYFAQDQSAFDQDSDDPVFPIDMKHETIDVGEMIYQAIKLQEPIIKLTPKEQEENNKYKDDEDYPQESKIGGEIVFRKAKK